MRLICILLMLTGTVYGQINPTTHLKPAVDTGYAMISAGTYNRYFPVSLYGYLRDTLAMDTSLSNELQTLSIDSNATTYTASISSGNSIKWAKSSGGSVAGSNTQIQYNASGSFGAESAFVWDYTNNRLGIGASSPSNIVDIVNNAANILRMYSSGGSEQKIRLQASSSYGDISYSGTDITYNTSSSLGSHLFKHAGTTVLTTLSGSVSLGTGVDLGLSASSSINDNNGSTGSSGQFLGAGTGGQAVWTNAPTTSPGGSDTHVQYNNGGAFGGESTMTYNDVTNQLTVEDLRVTATLIDGNNSAGSNDQILTSTGTATDYVTISNSISGRFLFIDYDGTPIAAGVDLASSKLTDAGAIENNNNAQDLHVNSLTKMTDWGTTPEFSGTGIVWSSASDRWTVTGAGKYEITFSVCLTSGATGDVALQFWVFVNGSAAGVPYYKTLNDTYDEQVTHTQVLSLSSNDFVEIYSARNDANTATVNFCSAVNGGHFTVTRVNYN